METNNFRSLILELDRRFPGFGDQIDEGMAVRIDGDIYQDAYLAPLNPDSEIYLIPKSAAAEVLITPLIGVGAARGPIYDDRAMLRSKSTFRFNATTRPSTPSRRRIELNSERCTASWLIVPSR